MSAEKEIVNYWYNSKGYFTIHNIKTSNNRDAGILALKDEELLHVQVSCSLTGTMDAKDMGKQAEKVSEEKFYDENITKNIEKLAGQRHPKKILVLNNLPKTRKERMMADFRMMDIEIVEFEDIIADVFGMLDTQYYKSYAIRTMQLVKYMLINNPSKLANIMVEKNMTSSSRHQLISNMLGKDEIVKEFRKTNAERLASILKSSGIKAKELAEIVGKDILNKTTRKTFLKSFMEQEKTISPANKIKRIRKDMMLERFI